MEYETIRKALEPVNAVLGPAEAHGLLVGLLVARNGVDPNAWLDEVLVDRDPSSLSVREGEKALRELLQETLAAWEDPGFGFPLLLPDDETPLGLRVQELGAWCEGFLVGYGLGQRPDSPPLQGEASEILEDFAQLSRIDEQVLDDNESEQNYADLTEFVRVGALLLRETWAENQAPSGETVH